MSVNGDDESSDQVRLKGLPPLIHPMAGAGFRRFWTHYVRNWPYDLRSLHVRLLSMLGITVRIPGVFLEGRRHNAAISEQQIEEGPVFVVGHWRSGTTHLHNLLSQDPQFGCISFSRSAMPLDCLGKVRPARTLINLLLPKTRGMDSVAIDADTPQEEEMALGALGDICLYKCFYFPRKLDHHFRRSVLLEDLQPGEREKLIKDYEYLVKKMSYLHEGKTVLFKNPASTARMALLKEIFPNAKFVHIVRDPKDVYPSMRKLWMRLLAAFSWQNPKGIDFHETTLSIYERTMRAHLEDREKIPAEDYHEIRFEDLDANPVETVREIYSALGLGNGEASLETLREYVDSQKDYQKNHHQLDEALREELAERWGFAFDQWGYEK